ncbi:Putative bacilysin exporter BacE [Streptomyces sp. S4.7]|uniref:MFS transporter n=1 Tax=Streptomyces sp. S4.7 TaxID=2705439 RepID=UPI0013979658|nr:MFS transporter [Streptomyces sp. S4.7]QHY99229.1 Putative bacilysin exporter BacE [Streptomyces sp. S4.7]
MPAILRRRNFVLLWLAGLISETGDWLLITGMPIYVYYLTGSPLITSTVFIVEMVPVVLLSSFAGVMIDRWNRGRVLLIIPLAQAVLLGPLLFVHSSAELWVVYLVAAAQAVLGQFVEPARTAVLPALVEPDQLGTANGLMGASSNLGRLVGSSLGGLALVGGSLDTIVIADAATFLLAGGLIAVTRFGTGSAPVEPSRPVSVVRAWRDGLSLIVGHRGICGTFVSMALSSMAQGLFLVLFIVFVDRRLHGGSAEMGLLRGIQAIGGLAGGLLVGLVGGRLGADRAITFGALGVGALSLAVWNGPYATTAIALYVGLFIAIGVPGMFHTAGTMTYLQLQTPPDSMGRVVGALLSVYGGFQVLGMLAAGVLADRLSVTVILEFQAGLYLLAALVARLTVRLGDQGRGGTRPRCS